eukprot:TRINITY_DN2360_c0_g2_i1.p3 TRINITY_DN2360_c0_g2~~TRINITY_DN2360_c0_g2_i1.p3  ORF type:complete len:116 (+),score=43.16 TRINITY_DN2360_c0_g2_i1:163-510(+)
MVIKTSKKQKSGKEKQADSKAATKRDEYKQEGTQQKLGNANREGLMKVSCGHLDVSKRDQVSEPGTIRLSEPSKQISQAEILNTEDPKPLEEIKEPSVDRPADKMLVLEVLWTCM